MKFFLTESRKKKFIFLWNLIGDWLGGTSYGIFIYLAHNPLKKKQLIENTVSCDSYDIALVYIQYTWYMFIKQVNFSHERKQHFAIYKEVC